MKDKHAPSRGRLWLAPLVLALAGFGAGCNSGESTAPEDKGSGGGNPVTAPVDYLDAAAKAKQKSEVTATTVAVQNAIKVFKVDKGRWPKDLNELVGPGYLSKLPDPPYGMKYEYDATTGQFKIVKQ